MSIDSLNVIVIGEWLDRELGITLVFTWQGAVIAAAVVAFPLVYKASRAAFEGVESQYEQAARVLGKSEWHVFTRVTLPLAWRGILAGAMLALARAPGEFGATLMVAGSLPGRTPPRGGGPGLAPGPGGPALFRSRGRVRR